MGISATVYERCDVQSGSIEELSSRIVCETAADPEAERSEWVLLEENGWVQSVKTILLVQIIMPRCI